MAGQEREWVVQPDTAHIDVAIGPEAKISPDLREALERLAKALAERGEVEGYMMLACTDNMVCNNVHVSLCDIDFRCSQVSVG